MTETGRSSGPHHPRPTERPSAWQRAARKLVERGDVAEILRTVDASRRGSGMYWATGPDQAVAMLECLATESDHAVLVEAIGTLTGDERASDAELLLDTAAVTRPSYEVAELHLMLIGAAQEQEGTRLAREFAAHRPPRDLARFTLGLHRTGDPARVRRFLRLVTERRTVRDVARLCLALRVADLDDHARQLLAAILDKPRTEDELSALTRVVGFQVLDDWISTRPIEATLAAERSPSVKLQKIADTTAEQAARLSAELLRQGHRPSPKVIRGIAAHWPVQRIRDLLAARGTGLRDDEAARLIDTFADMSQDGRARSYNEMIELLTLLLGEEPMEEFFTRLRDRLAYRRDIDGLVSLIIAWSGAKGRSPTGSPSSSRSSPRAASTPTGPTRLRETWPTCRTSPTGSGSTTRRAGPASTSSRSRRSGRSAAAAPTRPHASWSCSPSAGAGAATGPSS